MVIQGLTAKQVSTKRHMAFCVDQINGCVYMSGWLYRDLLPNRLMAVCICLDGYTGTYCQTGEYHVTRVNVCGRGKWLSVYMSGRTYCQTDEYHVTRGIVCGRGKWLRVYMSGRLYRTYCQTGEYHVTQGIVCGRGKWLRVYMSRWLHMDLLPKRWVPRERGIVCGPG
ncbi:LOW QUALITY PROTEIN: hypothetical protein MAR_018622 [Mya arenaria]|uniref:EGF-like domain-containing protein n=1 Tax=Mya arenaria TaxID=6604 RepID=A0ABY7EI00_MYAAR|nr:LOW QUALITY PROTEIN: hypothetical protein MAR_018622 [Mya arenaria]